MPNCVSGESKDGSGEAQQQIDPVGSEALVKLSSEGIDFGRGLIFVRERRAGGGEELAGLRALDLYHRRFVVQGPPELLSKLVKDTVEISALHA